MYDATADPCCYEGTSVLKNIAGIREQARLDEFETVMTAQRSDEPLPGGRLSIPHYKAIHHHLFQDIYPWAGSFRTVRIFKNGSAFCYPEHIAREMRLLFNSLRERVYLGNLSRERFAVEAAGFLSTLNATHPFREGNGRTQTTFLTLLAARAGHPLDLDKLEPEAFLSAMVASFKGNDKPLEKQLLVLTESASPSF